MKFLENVQGNGLHFIELTFTPRTRVQNQRSMVFLAFISFFAITRRREIIYRGKLFLLIKLLVIAILGFPIVY